MEEEIFPYHKWKSKKKNQEEEARILQVLGLDSDSVSNKPKLLLTYFEIDFRWDISYDDKCNRVWEGIPTKAMKKRKKR